MQKQIKAIITKLKALLAHWFHKYDEHLPYFITSIIALGIVIGGIKLFIEITDQLKSDLMSQVDTQITNYVLSFRSQRLSDYFIIITDIGDVYGYLIVFSLCAVVFYLIFKNWTYVAQLSLVLLLALSSNLLLKQVINRTRPEIEHLVTVKTLSYPSGHAMTAMAFYGFLIFLFYRFKIHAFLKTVIIIFLAVLILSIGISRIYLGVHFPSDVVGGFIAGFIWVVFCALIFQLIRIFKKDSKTAG